MLINVTDPFILSFTAQEYFRIEEDNWILQSSYTLLTLYPYTDCSVFFCQVSTWILLRSQSNYPRHSYLLICFQLYTLKVTTCSFSWHCMHAWIYEYSCECVSDNGASVEERRQWGGAVVLSLKGSGDQTQVVRLVRKMSFHWL